MLNRVDIVGNPNVGVFIIATDDVAIVPYSLLDEKAEIIKETLDVDVVKASISGSSLIGSLAVANSNGIVVSPHVLDREIEQFNILALAKNSIIIDAGLIQADGSIIHDKIISHSSLSIDENGKRRIEDAMFYSKDKINRGCTSYATPMALAKDFLPK